MTRPLLIANLLRCVPEFPHQPAAILAWAAAVVALSAWPAAPAVAAPLSPDAKALRRHVLAQGDHGAVPFLVLDKRRAHVWLFDARGRRRGDAPVLLGSARGDHTVPGIGDRPLAQVLPHERTTPAGRFVGEHGMNLRGEDVLWVDYDAAVSMHRVITGTPAERRAQRLASRTPADNRISYGCINLPRGFFDTRLRPWAAGTRPVIYVLPETRSWRTLFAPGAPAPAREASASAASPR